MTTKPTFDPQTSGVIVSTKGGHQVAATLATEVEVTDDHISFTEVRHAFRERGIAVPKKRGRLRFHRSIKGMTNTFVSIAERPGLAAEFGDRLYHDRFVSECE